MKGLVYYFDIGNTRLKLWRCLEGILEARWAGVHHGDPAALLQALPAQFSDRPSAVAGVSVLGSASDGMFSEAAALRWGCKPGFARSTTEFRGLRNAYQQAPERLGVDRWLGLIALAGDCDALCVVGCGTAVTIDVVMDGQHQGGYILPGLGLMESCLLQGTQRVRFEEAPLRSVGLGTDTATAVRNGALAAIVALVERVVADHGLNRLVLTGGDATAIAGATSHPSEVRADLLLEGLMRYFEELPDAGYGWAPD